MEDRNYKTTALVLKKVKLGERDLIVTMLDESGSLLQGVAKGARRPGSSLAAKLELFSAVDVRMAKGRSLDVVCEARFASSSPLTACSIEQGACAAPIAELVATVAQEDLPQPRLYDMVHAAFAYLAAADMIEQMPVLTAAALWKVMAQVGFRPRLDTCALCGAPIDDTEASAYVLFSLEDGGCICNDCENPADVLYVEYRVIQWIRVLLASRFADVMALELDGNTAFGILQFARQWVRVHTGKKLKSLDFLFTSGLF